MITELFSEKSKEAYFDYFNINVKKFRLNRFLIGILFFSLGAILSLLYENYLLLVGTAVAFYVGYKLPYLNLISRKGKDEILISFLFPQFFHSFFALLPTSGNVYQNFQRTLPYVNDPLRSEIEKLVKNIENENKREYYMEFADFVGTSDAYMIMDMTYQFSEYGIKKEALEEINKFIQNIQENKMDELITIKMSKMEKHGFMPLFISLFLVGGFALVIGYYFIFDLMASMDIF